MKVESIRDQIDHIINRVNSSKSRKDKNTITHLLNELRNEVVRDVRIEDNLQH